MTFSLNRRYTHPLACVAMLAAVFCLGAPTSAQTPGVKALPPRPSIGNLLNTDRLTPEIQPRDPKTDNGETQRIVMRNGLGIICKIEITFDRQINASAEILMDESGAVTEATLTSAQGTMSAKKGAHGPTDLRWVSSKGMLLLTGEDLADGYHLTRFSNKDGTPELVQVTTGNKRTDRLFQNGHLVAEAEYDGKVRLWLKVFFEDTGSLQYDEKLSSGISGGGEISPTILDYVGTIYDTNGKATHRVHFNEGPDDAGVGKVTQVEVLADDGSVAQTIPVDYPSKVKVPLGSYKDQDELIEDKRIVFAMGDDASGDRTTIETDLALLLGDKTR